jgi:hypothetical protein
VGGENPALFHLVVVRGDMKMAASELCSCWEEEDRNYEGMRNNGEEERN